MGMHMADVNITKSLLGVMALLLLPLATFAQGDDRAYCAQLGELARRYTGSAGGNGGLRTDFATVEAIDNCNKGNTAAGIKALEQKLRSNGFTLPKRAAPG